MAWPGRNMEKNKAIDLNEPEGPQSIYENDNLFTQLASVRQQFELNVHDVWMKNVDQQEKARKEIEDRLKKQEEELRKFKELCQKQSIKIAKMEARQDLKDACSSTDGGGEDVKEIGQPSRQQNSPSLDDRMCMACFNRMANMIWYPCRHLSICNRCEEDATECPTCGCKRFGTNVKINWS